MAVSTFGKIVRALGLIREYENGSHRLTGFVWRYWNPLTWIVIPLVVILSILFSGIPETFRRPHDLGFCVDPYYAKNKLPVRWLTRF